VSRAHNFSAGPAAIPETVIQEIIQALPEFKGTGMGLMEISHRSKQFDETLVSAESRLRSGARHPRRLQGRVPCKAAPSLQFYMTALNLLRPGEPADFVLTGVWSNKEIKEAKRVGNAQPADGRRKGRVRLPQDSGAQIRKEAIYVHTTSNNTIYGTQWHRAPGPPGATSCATCRPTSATARSTWKRLRSHLTRARRTSARVASPP
jgi:phosphoserine aminotransferase